MSVRFRLIRSAVLAGAAALLAACPGRESAPPTPASAPGRGAPDSASGPGLVLLVTVEGLGTSAGGALESAPALKELLGKDDPARPFFTSSPVLVPAIASILTGVSPLEHGVLDNAGRRIPPGATTLAQDFSASGFTTAAFVGSPLVSWLAGFERGFEVFDGANGNAFGIFRPFPEIRPASEVIGNALRWVQDLPTGVRAFAWIHLADLTAPFDIEADPARSQWKARLATLDREIARLREGIRAQAARKPVLVLTADRGSDIGDRIESGAGFFVDPAWTRVPLAVDAAEGVPEPRRPADTTGLRRFLGEIAGTPSVAGREGEKLPRVASFSALPWLWCRWKPAVAVASEDGSLWVSDGEWRRYAPSGEGKEVPESDVPEPVRKLASDLAARLMAPLPRGPKIVEAEKAARARGLRMGSESFTPKTPDLAARRDVVATLEQARSLAVKSRLRPTLVLYRKLAGSSPPNLAALLDMTVLLSLIPERLDNAWSRAKETLGGYGAHPVAIHWAAHTAIQQGELDLAEAFLAAYLERMPDEPDGLYDTACVRSLKGDMAGAEESLRRAIERGFRQWELISSDPDLRNLRADARFGALMRHYGR